MARSTVHISAGLLLGWLTCAIAGENVCVVGAESHGACGSAKASVHELTETGDEVDEVMLLQRNSLLQQNRASLTATADPTCKETYSPGMHLIKLPDVKRQFLLFVPKDTVKGPGGTPLVMAYHGFSDSPWYTNQAAGLSLLMERYGWLGLLPFGLNENATNGLGGEDACCPPSCTGECCRNGRHLNKKDATACRFNGANSPPEKARQAVEDDMAFTEAMVTWAGANTCTDLSKVFATGFSNGAMFANLLGCYKAELFRAVAPMSGDAPLDPCVPVKAISYISVCGTKDDEAKCQFSFKDTAKKWSHMMKCAGAGDGGTIVQMSATTTCTQWTNCTDDNFVEVCETAGLDHNPSGHLRPDDITYIRPGSDLDFPAHVFQKFSLLVNNTILFYGHPTGAELKYKESKWPPPQHEDHEYLRKGRLLGHDEMGPLVDDKKKASDAKVAQKKQSVKDAVKNLKKKVVNPKKEAKKETKKEAKKETKKEAKKETKKEAKKETKKEAKKETKKEAKKKAKEKKKE